MDTLKKEESQPHKMVKQTQNICRQKPTNCLSVFDHYVGLVLKGLIAGNWKNPLDPVLQIMQYIYW